MKDGKTDGDKYSYQLLEAYIEAEKQYLLVNLQTKHAINILREAEKTSRLEETLAGNITEGSVKLSHLRLRISQNTSKQGELFWWYFVVVRHNERILGTDFIAVFKPEIEKMVSPTIEFKEHFKIDKVKSDFMIVIELFGLYAVSPAADSKDTSCLTPRQSKKIGIFKSIRNNLTPKTRRSQSSVSDVDYPSGTPPSTKECQIEAVNDGFRPRFRNYAKGYISLGNVKNGHCGAIKLESFDDTCCLEPKLTFQFGCQYVILRKLSSFLTVTQNSQPLWTRYWAALQNDKLEFWSYPNDKENGKEPVKTIILSNLSGSSIMDNKDYSSCRPFTFHISTDDNKTRYSISCDDKQDFLDWKSTIFDQIQDLKAWQHSLHS